VSGHGCGKPASDFDVPRDDDCQRPTSLVSAIARAVRKSRNHDHREYRHGRDFRPILFKISTLELL